MASGHADAAREAVSKLATLPLLAGENVSYRLTVPMVVSCVDLVLQLRNVLVPGAGGEALVAMRVVVVMPVTVFPLGALRLQGVARPRAGEGVEGSGRRDLGRPPRMRPMQARHARPV